MDKEIKKKLIELYEMFPSGSVSEGMLSPMDKSDLQRLKKDGFLNSDPVYNEKKKKVDNAYTIGPNFFSVISAWKNEEMTKSMVAMTNTIVYLTFFGIFIALSSLFFSSKLFTMIEALIWSFNVVLIMIGFWEIIRLVIAKRHSKNLQ